MLAVGGIALLSCARRMAPRGIAHGLVATAPVRAVRAPEVPRTVGGPRLDHAKHLGKGLECADCHLRGAAGEKPTEPQRITYEACAECHDDEDKALPAEKKVRNVFFHPDGSPAWEKAIQGYAPEVKWRHAPHEKVACTQCHGALDQTPRQGRRPFDMAGCMSCHQQSKAPATCAACHTTLRDDHAPPSHATDWRRLHGAAAEAGQERCELCHRDPAACDRCHQHTPPASHDALWRSTHGPAALARAQRCEMCHTNPGECVDCHLTTRPDSHAQLWTERHGQAARDARRTGEGRCDLCHLDPNFCSRCHQLEQPRNHTQLFRTRTHGVLAAIDRGKCRVCHETDFCVRCHQDTRPRSHGPLWATGPSLHCAQCHFPIASETSCRVCHFQEPTHSTAPDQPPWHTPGMNCRLCHTPAGSGAPPLRHIDNGTQCEKCHH